ncbi:hypothetical protein [Lacticaseibacillus salsurivasis]|uniref:hypothetical protein n=1 Tax=Lacticaseibacillus salsurivasis TaxID=3081441 RepID=UPI0030C76159
MKEHIYMASANDIYAEAIKQKNDAADRMAALIGDGEALDDMQRAANEYDAFSHMVEFIEALEDKKAAGMQAGD